MDGNGLFCGEDRRSGGASGWGLRIRLGNADVAADLVLAHFVDDQFLGEARAGSVEENRLVKGAILLLEALVFHGHEDAILIALLIDAPQLNRHIADLLGLVFAGYGKLNVVALAKPAELVDFVMVA